MSARVYRGAFVGFGAIARQAHLPAFEGDPLLRERVRMVAAIDIAHAFSESAEDTTGGLLRLSSLDQLDTIGAIDFVDVCTPTALHAELAAQALERGLHVLCEKPVATTRAEADRLAAAAARGGGLLLPCHQYHYNPVWRQVSRWLSAGIIGRWHLAELAVHRPAADGGIRTDGVPWRGLGAHSRGGILLDHGTHWIYLLLAAGGRPTAVNAWTGRILHAEYDVEDTVHLLLEFPDRIASLFLTWAGHQRENRLRFTGEHGVIEWDGAELRLDARDCRQTLDVSQENGKAAYAHWFAALFREFVSALDEQRRPALADEVRPVAEVLESVYGAAAAGSRMTVAAA